MHYRTLVILPRGQHPETNEEAKALIAPLMAPYDENKDVPPYIDDNGEETTYNRDSQWDYFLIGGRYSGHFTADGRDIFPLTNLCPDWSAWNIVTPHGKWFARSTWNGSEFVECPNWDALKYEIASAFPDHIGVCVDVHI